MSGATVYTISPELPWRLRLCTSQGSVTRTLTGSWDVFGIYFNSTFYCSSVFCKDFDPLAPLIHLSVLHCANSLSDPDHNPISTPGLLSTLSCPLTPGPPWFAFVVLVWCWQLLEPTHHCVAQRRKCRGGHSKKAEMTTECSNQGGLQVERCLKGRDH